MNPQFYKLSKNIFMELLKDTKVFAEKIECCKSSEPMSETLPYNILQP